MSAFDPEQTKHLSKAFARAWDMALQDRSLEVTDVSWHEMRWPNKFSRLPIKASPTSGGWRGVR